MAWVKTNSLSISGLTADVEVLSDFLCTTYLPTRGWTNVWIESATNARFYSLKRTITLQDGTTLPYNVIINISFAGDDLVYFGWNGTDNYADWFASNPQTIYNDTSWAVTQTGGLIETWDDQGSDGYILVKKLTTALPRIFGAQLPDGGFVSQPLNANQFPGTRPNSVHMPFSDLDAKCFHNTTTNDMNNAILPPVISVDDVWQDYTACSQQSDRIFWEDPSQTWKMLAKNRPAAGFSELSVAKIDSEYYLNTGAFLIPAGSTEPVL